MERISHSHPFHSSIRCSVKQNSAFAKMIRQKGVLLYEIDH